MLLFLIIFKLIIKVKILFLLNFNISKKEILRILIINNYIIRLLDKNIINEILKIIGNYYKNSYKLIKKRFII